MILEEGLGSACVIVLHVIKFQKLYRWLSLPVLSDYLLNL